MTENTSIIISEICFQCLEKKFKRFPVEKNKFMFDLYASLIINGRPLIWERNRGVSLWANQDSDLLYPYHWSQGLFTRGIEFLRTERICDNFLTGQVLLVHSPKSYQAT